MRTDPDFLRLPLRSPAWLLLPIVVLRAAGLVFGAFDLDECDFLVLGRMMAAGEWPYVGFFEKKPPLSFLFYAPVALTGFHLWLVQLIAIAWVFGTCLVVAEAARTWTQRREAGWVAGWLACLVQVNCAPAVNCETMLNLPAAVALLFFVRAERSARLRDDLLTGIAIGFAVLFKHQAGILLVSLLASLLWQRTTGPSRLLRATAIVSGFALPCALACGVYAAWGHLGAFFEWNVTRNLHYQAKSAGWWGDRLAVGLLIGVVLAAPLQWSLAVRETARLLRAGREKVRDPILLGLVLTLWLTIVPVSLGRRFYEHYFIQFSPALALVATPGALRLLDAWPSMTVARRRTIVLALALPLLFFLCFVYGAGLLGRLPLQEPRTRELATWVRTHSTASDRIFVWGHYSPVYDLSERLPASRHYNSSVLVGDFDPHHVPDGFDFSPYISDRDVAQTLDDLRARRPLFIVDTAPADIHEWHRVPLSVVPALQRYVQDHYEIVAHPAGAAVYRLRMEPSTPAHSRGQMAMAARTRSSP